MGADAAEPAEYAAAVAFFALAYVCGLAGFRAIGWPAKDVGEAASMIGGFVHCTGALGEGLRARACPVCAQERETDRQTHRQTDKQSQRARKTRRLLTPRRAPTLPAPAARGAARSSLLSARARDAARDAGDARDAATGR